jgi:hypothetical protein
MFLAKTTQNEKRRAPYQDVTISYVFMLVEKTQHKLKTTLGSSNKAQKM